MEYLPFVEKHAAQFGEFLKTAEDLAKLLDQDFFQPKAIGCLHPYLQKNAAVARFDLVEDLSALALRHSAPIPDLEHETLYLIFGYQSEDAPLRSKELSSHIVRQLAEVSGGGQGRNVLAGFAEALIDFPVLSEVVDWKATLAWVNLLLMGCGGQPFRELANRKPGKARHQNPPSRTLRVVIAESDQRSFLSTLDGLAGFPGLDFVFIPLDAYDLRSRLDSERAADDLLAGDPDILVLSDRACGEDGLSLLLSQRAAEGRPVIVAASDIPESVASAQGILSSLKYGYNLGILQTAFMLLGA